MKQDEVLSVVIYSLRACGRRVKWRSNQRRKLRRSVLGQMRATCRGKARGTAEDKIYAQYFVCVKLYSVCGSSSPAFAIQAVIILLLEVLAIVSCS